MKQNIFQDDREKGQHEDAINQLCQEFPGQEDSVLNCYWDHLAQFTGQATIRTYLTILVSREVRKYLAGQEKQANRIQ